jgi:hypothetical protein
MPGFITAVTSAEMNLGIRRPISLWQHRLAQEFPDTHFTNFFIRVKKSTPRL